MFKIGLENRDFCKSLHFYIMDAGKKKKKTKKKNELHLLACSAALYIFFLCCGALASALMYSGIDAFAVNIFNCLSFPLKKSYNNFGPQVCEIIVCTIILFL